MSSSRTTVWCVNQQRALDELRKLREQADAPEVRIDGPQHRTWKTKVDAIMKAALGADSGTLQQFRDLRYTIGISSGAPGEDEQDAHYFASQVSHAAGLVDAAIYELGLQLEQRDQNSQPRAGAVTGGPIFVVHGRDDGRKYELMRLLDRAVATDAIVLHEQPNLGGTILEKFERHAQAASFAIVLLTADDEGRIRGDEALPLRYEDGKTSYWSWECSSVTSADRTSL